MVSREASAREKCLRRRTRPDPGRILRRHMRTAGAARALPNVLNYSTAFGSPLPQGTSSCQGAVLGAGHPVNDGSGNHRLWNGLGSSPPVPHTDSRNQQLLSARVVRSSISQSPRRSEGVSTAGGLSAIVVAVRSVMCAAVLLGRGPHERCGRNRRPRDHSFRRAQRTEFHVKPAPDVSRETRTWNSAILDCDRENEEKRVGCVG